jgi:hypothetical protein
MIQREKGNVNALLLDRNNNVPPNSDLNREMQNIYLLGMKMCQAIMIQREKGNVIAPRLDGNIDVPPNYVLRGKDNVNALLLNGMPNADVPPNSDSKR